LGNGYARRAHGFDIEHRIADFDAASQHVEIEFQQRLSSSHSRALRHQRIEASAVQPDSIDTDVKQNLGAVIRAQSHRMHGRGNRNDLAITGRMQRVACRIDGNAVAH
jgi:hypothetical protein